MGSDVESQNEYGDVGIDFRAPEKIAQVYEHKGDAAKLARDARENPEMYAREVSKPFFVDTGGLTTLDGQPARRASILLKSPGCSKRRSHAESNEYPNCAFCVFSENYSTGGNPVTPEQYEQQMVDAMNTVRPSFQFESEHIDIIEIFNSGSFFSDEEISADGRKRIIDVVRENSPKNIVLTVEAKFADIVQSQDKVDEVLAWLNSDGGTRRLEIAFGLETTDQIIGEQLRKSISEEALRGIIDDLAKRNVRSFFYILLKPGLMSENFAIKSAIESAVQVAQISKDLNLKPELKPHVSLGPTRTYRDSLLHMFRSYKAPMYWSIAETIKQLCGRILDGESNVFDYLGLHVGLSGEGISIVTGGNPDTGSKYCNEKVIEILSSFNHDMDQQSFLRDYNELLSWENDPTNKECHCYKDWLQQLKQICIETINTKDEVITNEQLEGVMRTEEEAWPEEVRAPREKFESRMKVFPEGFFLGYEFGIIAGVSTSEISNFEPTDDVESWEKITNNGFISPVHSEDGTITGGHNKDGNSLYVVSLGVRAQYKGNRIGVALIEAQKELVKQKNLKYLFLGSRVPGFKKAKDDNPSLTIEQFVNQKDGDNLADPDIRFYTGRGLKIARIKENYMEDDPESGNYGVIMYWENDEYDLGI
ncbi:MAG: hypothetical protein NTZ65_04475 [Candidatus Berkelbacteria bacterium]|nr:hypothetical protein [Candidatus Berkelbacteria bacterium]